MLVFVPLYLNPTSLNSISPLNSSNIFPPVVVILGFLSINLNNRWDAPVAVTILLKEELIELVALANEPVYITTEASYPEVKSLSFRTRYPPYHKTANVAMSETKELMQLYNPLDKLFL